MIIKTLEEAIEVVKDVRSEMEDARDGIAVQAIDMVLEAVKEQRPHGEWIWKKDEDALRTYDLLCSECGYKTFTCENYDNVEQAKKVVDDRIREGKTLFHFCPNCGADMRKKSPCYYCIDDSDRDRCDVPFRKEGEAE